MECQLLYFARLREVFGKSGETLHISPTTQTVADVLAQLRARGGVWQIELSPGKSFRVAVNEEMAFDDTAIKSGDAIAVFPPVTGG